jgi:hypothetical protein
MILSLHFDDRLQTLLDAPVADARDRAVRWRQLVDLLARGKASDGAMHAAALELVRREAFAVDEEVRAATLRAIAGLSMPADLLAVLAAQPLRVAAALFAGLTLTEEDAAHILGGAHPEVRALVRIKSAPAQQAHPATELVETGAVHPAPSIGEMVSRIEQLQQRRAPAAQPAAPALPEPSPPPPRQSLPQPAEAKDSRLFKWESDASGHIAWVEGAPRGILVGRPLSGSGVGLLERDVAARLVRHHPFADAPVALSGLFAGTWEATGRPAFDTATGRFIGYRGLARRTDQAAPADRKKREPDLDALREMVHEIKTPLNAIIGFAEIIDGQYLGPAHRLYRERAASIVAQARQLLAAVEDLDFAAKVRADRGAGGLHAGAGGAGGGLSDLIRPIAVEMGGRGDRIRTCDPLVPNQVRYQPAPLPDSTFSTLSATRPARSWISAALCSIAGPAFSTAFAAVAPAWLAPFARASAPCSMRFSSTEIVEEPLPLSVTLQAPSRRAGAARAAMVRSFMVILRVEDF